MTVSAFAGYLWFQLGCFQSRSRNLLPAFQTRNPPVDSLSPCFHKIKPWKFRPSLGGLNPMIAIRLPFETRNLSRLARIYMIGDNPAADIRGANQAGDPWRSILVCTGRALDGKMLALPCRMAGAKKGTSGSRKPSIFNI